MKQILIQSSSTKVRQHNYTNKNVLLTIVWIWTLVWNLLLAEPAKALDVSLQMRNPDYNPEENSKEETRKNREKFLDAKLSPDQIVAIEQIINRGVSDRRNGIISTRATIKVDSTWCWIKHAPENNLKLPTTINRNNYQLFVDTLLDYEANNVYLWRIGISDSQKKSIYERTRLLRQEFQWKLTEMETKYWKQSVNDWLKLFNELKTMSPNQTRTILSSLFENSQRIIAGRYEKINASPRKKQELDKAEIINALNIYLQLKWKYEWILISYNIIYSGTEEYYYVIWQNKLGFLWISTKKMIQIAKNDYEEFRKKWAAVKVENSKYQPQVVKSI